MKTFVAAILLFAVGFELYASLTPIGGGGAGGGGDALTTNPLSQFAATTSAQLAGVITNETGSGLLVFATSPTFTTPILGVPTSVTLTNATGLPAAGIGSGTIAQARLGTGSDGSGTHALFDDQTYKAIAGGGDALVANPLSQFAATTSSQFKGVISDENAPDGASSKVIMALGSLSIASGKTATFDHTSTFTTTDGQTYTFPTTSATLARTDAANTFTGTQTVGALVATTVNGNTVTTGTGVLTLGAGKTTTFDHTSTFTTTDAQTYTFPTTSATIARTDAANTFTGHQTVEGVTSTGATGTGKFAFDTAPTIAGPTFSGTTTITGSGGATIDNSSASAGTISSSGGGQFNITAPIQLSGNVKDSAGSFGTSGYALVGNGSGALTYTFISRSTNVPFFIYPGTTTGAITSTSGFITSSNRSQVDFDSTGYTQARIKVLIGGTASNATTTFTVKYFTATTTTIGNLIAAGTGATQVSVTVNTTTNTEYVGGWVTLTSGAIGDVFWSVVAVDTANASLNPTVSRLDVEFR